MGFHVRAAYKFQVVISGFCGLMYGILYDHADVINCLLDELPVRAPLTQLIPVSFSTTPMTP